MSASLSPLSHAQPSLNKITCYTTVLLANWVTHIFVRWGVTQFTCQKTQVQSILGENDPTIFQNNIKR